MTLTRVDNSNSRAYSPHWRHNILGNYTMSVSSESLTTWTHEQPSATQGDSHTPVGKLTFPGDPSEKRPSRVLAKRILHVRRLRHMAIELFLKGCNFLCWYPWASYPFRVYPLRDFTGWSKMEGVLPFLALIPPWTFVKLCPSCRLGCSTCIDQRLLGCVALVSGWLRWFVIPKGPATDMWLIAIFPPVSKPSVSLVFFPSPLRS